MNFELSIFNFLHDFAGASRLLDLVIIFLAKYLGYFLILAAIAFLLSNKSRFLTNSIFISLSIILSRGLIAEIIRFIFPRLRPFAALDFEPLVNHSSASSAFPSGHASFYFALAMALIVLNYRWKWWVLAGVCLMGLARVFAGVHWPLDILAGALVGIFSVFVVKYILPRTKE